MEVELDVRGEVCPYPAMKAREALERLGPDDKLIVRTDHAPALSTVPWEGAKLGFAFTILVLGDEDWSIAMERSPTPIDRAAVLAEIARVVEELGVT